MSWNALTQSRDTPNSRNSIPIMSLPTTASPSADEIYSRRVDRLGHPAVENGLRHLDDLDQIFVCSLSFLTYRKKISRRGSPRDGGSTETLSAKRGTMRFAVTAGVFSVTYEPWSSRIFRSLTEYESE